MAGFELIEMKLRFQTLDLDPIGEHRLWYKWVFFNDEETCKNIPGTCLQDAVFSSLDGNAEPYYYTVYYNWNDFYDLKEIETIFWIMLATSWLGVIAFPAELVFCSCLNFYMIFFGYVEYSNYLMHPSSDYYQWDILNLLTLSFGISVVATTLFLIYMLFPIIGPLINIAVMWISMQEMERLTIPIKFEVDDLF